MDCLAPDVISRMSGVRSSSCRSIRRPERTALTDEASVVNLISHLIERQLKLSPTLTRDVVVQRELRVPMPNGALSTGQGGLTAHFEGKDVSFKPSSTTV